MWEWDFGVRGGKACFGDCFRNAISCWRPSLPSTHSAYLDAGNKAKKAYYCKVGKNKPFGGLLLQTEIGVIIMVRPSENGQRMASGTSGISLVLQLLTKQDTLNGIELAG